MRPLTAERRYPRIEPPLTRAPVRRDPAPTRLAYRWQRLCLSPLFRFMLRFGLPVICVAAFGLFWFADETRRADLVERVATIRDGIEERPEFMVTLMAIDGAPPELAEAIRVMMPITLPISSFDLDLEALRATVAAIDAVQAAELRLRPGGILEVSVRLREPVAIWRRAGRFEMIDATGHRVASIISRETRADLPLLAGPGADRVVGEARAVLAEAGPIRGRVRGLIRVGERRWDLMLDREQVLMLPESDPVSAVARVVALDAQEQLLARDIRSIDLRNPDRVTIRLGASALDGTGEIELAGD